MVSIVSGYKTKKALKEAVLNDPTKIYIDDPSFINPKSGYIPEVIEQNTRGIAVTNHPKRSWFATIKWSERKKAYTVT